MVENLSIYIHIPFCKHKCPYCHFYVISDKEHFKEQLAVGLEREWELLAPKIQEKNLVSVYFGGGTPTLFGPKRVERVLKNILKHFQYDSSLEVTIETNPEEKAPYASYRDIGINRVSMGVQSLNEDELALLHRKANPQESIEAVYACHDAGIKNITIDLMYDLPSQSLTSWQKTLSCIKGLPITHLSLYNLTIEPDAAFFRREKELRALMPNDETSGEMYRLAQEYLQDAGFTQYEISAFCKDDMYSRHNVGYWTGRHFYGLGPSAFSFDGVKRYRNVANLARYSTLLEAGELPIDFVEEPMDAAARKKELLALNLRLLKGVDLQKYAPLDSETEKALEYLVEVGLLSQSGSHAALTPKGILFYDTVASELI